MLGLIIIRFGAMVRVSFEQSIRLPSLSHRAIRRTGVRTRRGTHADDAMAKDDPSAAGHHAETERGEEGNMQEGRIPAQIETHHDDHVNASNEMSRTKACRTMHLDCGYEVTAAVPLSMSTEEATTHIITSTYNVSQHQLHVQAMVNQLVSTSTNATSSDRTSVSGSMSASRPPRDPATAQHNLISMTESSLLQPYRHAILLACKDPKSYVLMIALHPHLYNNLCMCNGQ